MIAVAVVAVVYGTAIGLLRRRATFAMKADEYGRMSLAEYEAGLRVFYQRAFVDDPDATHKAHHRLSEHYDGLSEKYRRAASHPWLPVEPDPPPPK
jgi:hypothetical protein